MELKTPVFPGQAHGEMQGNHIWDDSTKAWVAIEHIAEPDEETIKKEFDGALVKAGVTEERIAQLREHALKFDKPITSKKERAEADTARKQIRQVRLIGEKNIERIHSRYVALWKMSNEMRNRLIPRLGAPEVIIEKRIEEYDSEQERIEREAAETKARIIRERVKALEGFGFTRRAGSFPEPDTFVNRYGTVITTEQVETQDVALWGNLIRSAEQAWQEEQDRIAAQEEARRQEEERLRKEREELAAREAELAWREKQMQDAINTIRKNELLALGCVELADGRVAVCTNHDGRGALRIYKFVLVIADLHSIPDEQWKDEVLAAKAAIEELNLAIASAKERENRERLIAERVDALKRNGWTVENSEDGEVVDLELNGAGTGTRFYASTIADMDQGNFDDLVRMGAAELDRREEAKQAEAARHEKRQARYNAMKAAGYESECGDGPGDGCAFTILIDGKPFAIDHAEAYAMSEDDFAALVRKGHEEIQRRKLREQEAIRQRAIEEERQRQEAEAKRKAEDEERRKAQLSDAQKWQEWVAAVQQSAPKMSSQIGAHAVKRVISGLVSMTPGLIQDLNK